MGGIEVSSAGTSANAVSGERRPSWKGRIKCFDGERQRQNLRLIWRCFEGHEDCLFRSAGRRFVHATGVGRVASNEGDSMVAPGIGSEDLRI
jgi:hypothetical protein